MIAMQQEPFGSLVVVSREDCDLCGEMLAALAHLGRSMKLPPVTTVDVDSDPELQRRHGLHVPVLLLDGSVVCRHHLDESELRRLLKVRT
jgi:predicted thioredoxin/glutaredoxin